MTLQARKGGTEVVLVGGVRTPFAKSGKELGRVPVQELARVAMSQLVARLDFDPALLDEVVLGCAGQPADAPNLARVAALQALIPRSVEAHTVQRNCASGMQSAASACDRILAGRATWILAGGAESMSYYPLQWSRDFSDRFFAVATGKGLGRRLGALLSIRPRHLKPVVTILQGLTDPVCGLNMGETAENLAREFRISREQQDARAVESHRRAAAAAKEGRLAPEIVPVFLPPSCREAVERDTGIREGQSMEALAKLRPAFDRRYGTVTAGNSCPISDGACAILLARSDAALAAGYKPLAKIRSYAFAGLDPSRMGLGPVYASAKALDEAGLAMSDIGLVELNEAFAAQVIACERAFDSREFAGAMGRGSPIGALDPARVNVNGGAIALGHPVGTSGTRLLLTLALEMGRRNVPFGLATLCIGGGQGAAFILERDGDCA